MIGFKFENIYNLYLSGILSKWNLKWNVCNKHHAKIVVQIMAIFPHKLGTVSLMIQLSQVLVTDESVHWIPLGIFIVVHAWVNNTQQWKSSTEIPVLILAP